MRFLLPVLAMAFCASLILARLSLAAEPPPKIDKLITQINAIRADAVRDAQEELREAQAALRKRDRNRTKEQTRELAENVKRLTASVEALTKGDDVVLPDLDLFSPTVGAIGQVPEGVILTVAQVVDGTTMHVIPEKTQTEVYFEGFVANQRFVDVRGERVGIRKFSTASLADGKKFSSRTAFEVVGTESYVTVTGAKATVYVLEPFDVKEWLPTIQEKLLPFKTTTAPPMARKRTKK